MSPLLALFGPDRRGWRRLFLRVQRTSQLRAPKSEKDPKRTKRQHSRLTSASTTGPARRHVDLRGLHVSFRSLPLGPRGYFRRKRCDVVSRVAKKDELSAVRQRDRLVEFEGPEQSGRRTRELAGEIGRPARNCEYHEDRRLLCLCELQHTRRIRIGLSYVHLPQLRQQTPKWRVNLFRSSGSYSQARKPPVSVS